MSAALDPATIFRCAAQEGKRRLDQTLLELTATGFIAGFTIVFGIMAMGIVHAASHGIAGDFARVLAALGFAFGMVFLILGRAELFSENFFDPIATMFEPHDAPVLPRLARLWSVTFLLNMAGGAILVFVLSVEGVLPDAARQSLAGSAVELAERHPLATTMRAIVGGALVALLSYLAIAANSTTGRALVAYAVGFLLALGPFEHVVVSALHLLFGIRLGAGLDMLHAAETVGLSLLGNLIGGVGLVTLSHAGQAKGAEKRRQD